MTISQTFTMGRLAHEWLKHELDPEFTRKVETVASGTGNIKTGSVLGRVTSSGRLGWYDPTANDGREVPYGILLNAVDASASHHQAVVIVGKAVINPLALTWGPAVDDAHKRAAGVALLESQLGFVTRTVV